MTVSAATLSAALRSVSAAVPTRSPKPVLQNVLIRDGVITATDLELRITAPLEGSRGHTLLLPFARLSAIIGSLVITHNDRPRLIATQCALATLSCVAYGAVFLLIGVIAPARAMVLGVIYAIVFEVAAAFIPAAINLLTIERK
jgi:hypothetical protein